MMTLDEAIEHCKEKSCGNTECALEHKQLAEWLKELKGLRANNSIKKIRDEIEYIRSFIDSVQEEPKKCMYSKDNYTDEDRKVLCDGCEEDCKYNKKETVNDNCLLNKPSIPDIVDDHFYEMLGEEPVSEGLEKAAEEWDESLYRSDAFKAGANWQKKKMMAKAVDGEIGYWNIRGLSVNAELPHSIKEGDKVKVILIKEATK